MYPPISTSLAARRVGDSPISDLMARALANPSLISLAAGFVDHGSLPLEETAISVASMCGDEVEGRRSLQYGTTRGDLSLRRRLITQIEAEDGVPAGQYAGSVDRMIVTSGSQQLLYLVTEAVIDPGDIVIVESPTYFVFLGVLRAHGARVVGVEVDEGGMRLDSLEDRLAQLEASGELDRVKLIYTVSEHSNPTGLSLESERRGALVALAKAWSRKGRILVLEDAAYRGLTYEGVDPKSIWSHDETGKFVILARTFSKTFSPGLKLGYGILPEALVGPVLALKGSHDFGSAHFSQQLLERILGEGFYPKHVEHLRGVYRRKLHAMRSALEEHFAEFRDEVSWTNPRGGLYVWATFPELLDTGRSGPFFARCVEEGVLYVPGELAYPDAGGSGTSNHARLSFGVASESSIQEGVRRLARAYALCRELAGVRPGIRLRPNIAASKP